MSYSRRKPSEALRQLASRSKTPKLELRASEWGGLECSTPGCLVVEIASSFIKQVRPDEVRVRGSLAMAIKPSSLVKQPILQYDTVIVNVNCPTINDKQDTGFWVLARQRGTVLKKAFFESHRTRHAFLVPLDCFRGKGSVTIDIEPDSRAANGKKWDGLFPELSVKVQAASRSRIDSSVAESTVFIFSTARSGSTWLASDILCWRDRARAIDEPGLGQLFAPLRWEAERFAQLGKVNFYIPAVLDSEDKKVLRQIKGNDLPVFERQNAFLVGPSQIFNDSYIHNLVEVVRKSIIDHSISDWGLEGFRKYVIKMPNESHAADILLRALPEAHVIHLVRDGRDVMRSRFGAFSSQVLEETKDAALRNYAIAFYSHFWNFQNEIIANACANHDQKRVRRVRYETLNSDRLNECKSILEWLGLSLHKGEDEAFLHAIDLANAPPEETGFGKRRGEGVVGAFRQAFSVSEIQLMEQIMGPVLERFGYSLVRPEMAEGSAFQGRDVSDDPIGKIKAIYAESEAKDRRIQELREESEGRAAWAHRLDREIASKDARIVELQEESQDRSAWAHRLNQEIAGKNSRIVELQNEIEQFNALTKSLRQQLIDRDEQLAELRRSLQ